MKLLVDSGSTKTDWAFLAAGKTERLSSAGINSTQQGQIAIEASIAPIVKGKPVTAVYFYGAGVIPNNQHKITRAFQKLLPNVVHLEVNNDILGAAHALCQHTPGIVGILGTGSNSCVYDGFTITKNIGGFGFILGDEGSGAVLGKKLLHDFLYKKMPSQLAQELTNRYQLDTSTIFQRVYHKAFPNRYLATFAPFLHQHRSDDYIRNLLEEHFTSFFLQKVMCYPEHQNYSCHLVGSVAYFFASIIEEIAAKQGIHIGNIIQTPMTGLIKYHT